MSHSAREKDAVKRCQVRVTITKIFDAEIEDTPGAASRMFKALEADRQVAVLCSASGEGWKVHQASEGHTVTYCDPVVDPVLA